MRLRTGESTLEDWQLLLSRQPSHVQNLDEFTDAVATRVKFFVLLLCCVISANICHHVFCLAFQNLA